MTEELKHPEPCQACDDYYAYQDGLCWQCWHARQEVAADEKIAPHHEEKHLGESA